ncbi:holliday junction ATP-dependent DNA helicase RuvA [Clostridium aceticum]|uniref:Holliday junction branch migration complex subunit RuvA n=1 Tax=Clostridium aceticum TaxID=84022 RepID=A0A0D8ICN1_9CLOT|nr:holliday junction ATP-dependent DNA helicase RuvA [Clostridium aceticum]KJF28043.1 ATP-dependent DNA helicase RuvA [Clostridium aceticum]
MFEYIKGVVSDVILDKIIVEVGGIGYRIHSSIHSAAATKPGETITIFTHFVVREDEISLYGFTTKEELNMFEKLISVSKIGPKVGTAVLSTYTPAKLANYIINNDIQSISKVPGIGKKTAERIILELRDKVKQWNLETEEDMVIDIPSSYEVIEALMALGYNRQEAEKAFDVVKKEKLPVEEMIKKALKLLVR